MKWFRRQKAQETAALPLLKTERLVLRTFEPSDAVDVYAYAQSEEVGPNAGWAPHKCLDDSRRIVESFIREGEVWAIVEKKSGHVIGSVGLHAHRKRRVEGCRELGYVLGEASWGQGYMTEACREVLRYAFDVLQCPVVSVGHFPSNTRSKRVIKKLGFVHEGTLRCAFSMPDGSVNDEVCYSLLRSEYEAQRAKEWGRNGHAAAQTV